MFYMDHQLDDDFSQAITLQLDDDAEPVEVMDGEDEDLDELDEEQYEEIEDSEAI